MKSGLCPEDCGYCSQRLGSTAEIMKYSWISPAEAADNAQRAIAAGAKRVCLVASGRGPRQRDLDRVADDRVSTVGQAKAAGLSPCSGRSSGWARPTRTSPGDADLAMIADAGFTIEGSDEQTLPEHRHDLVTSRRPNGLSYFALRRSFRIPGPRLPWVQRN